MKAQVARRLWCTLLFSLLIVSLSVTSEGRPEGFSIAAPGVISTIRYSPKGNYIYLDTSRGNYLWQTKQHRLIKIPDGLIALSPNERFVAAYQDQKRSLVIFNTTGRKTFKTRQLDQGAGEFAFSPDGETLAWNQFRADTLEPVTELRLWEFGSNKQHVLTRWYESARKQLQDGVEVRSIRVADWHRGKGILVNVRGIAAHQERVYWCWVDPKRDATVGRLFEWGGLNNIGPETTLADGSFLYDWSELSGNGRYTTYVLRIDPKTRKHETIFVYPGALLPLQDGRGGYCSARDAMKVVVYGVEPVQKRLDLPARHRRYRTYIWLIDVKSKKRTLVVRGVHPGSSEGPFVGATLAPDGHWLAYESFTSSRRVIIKRV